MMNDKFEPIHLVERKITTPLFRNAREALGVGSGGKRQPMKYMVIESNQKIPESIFFNAPICPVFLHGGRSYIYLEGECLFNYFLARKHKDIVLTEEQIWKLLLQVGRALLVLRENGVEHHHLKQYAIRRVNQDNFRLLYHPNLTRPLDLISQEQARWYHFYFAPEQLQELQGQKQASQGNHPSSCVFSLSAMVLNIMNPLDSKRDIYSSEKYDLNNRVLEEKLANAAAVYSKTLVDIIRLGICADPNRRLTLMELLKIVEKNDPVARKNRQIEGWKQSVATRLSRSRDKKTSPPTSQHSPSPAINFNRGTFGGHSEADSDSDKEHSSQSEEAEPLPKPTINKITYNDYHQKLKKEDVKPSSIHKSPSAPTYASPSPFKLTHEDTLQEEDPSGIDMSEMSIFEDGKQREVLTYQINSFHQRVCEYHIKLSQCLQPLQDLIGQLGGQGTWMGEDVYYGHLINGRRNGVGLEVFPNGQYYYGNFKDDLFHGEGFYFWHNSQYFLGVWESGNKVEGTWQGKAKYVGQIKHNRRHGIGSCYYPSGRTYEGEWYEGKYQGSGILTEPSGQKFIGLFRGGRKWGKGYFLTDSCRITGIWDGDAAVGSVQISFQNGNSYIGLINEGFQKEGQGQFRFKNGVICKGVFAQDEFVSGQVRYRNGQRYVGQMRDYRRHGLGTYYYANGRVAEGRWMDGTFQGQGKG